MIDWLEYDYLIVSRAGECVLDLLSTAIMSRTEMKPRGHWIIMGAADALLIVMDDAKGLLLTDHPDRFGFDGNRPDFDAWMAIHHPNVAYRWLDHALVAFADRAAQLSFSDDLGQRVLRAKHLPRTVPAVIGNRPRTVDLIAPPGAPDDSSDDARQLHPNGRRTCQTKSPTAPPTCPSKPATLGIVSGAPAFQSSLKTLNNPRSGNRLPTIATQSVYTMPTTVSG